MTELRYNDLAFKRFVEENYDINESKIELKYKHSLRVAKLCERIAENENLNKSEINLAYNIGLLHDIARFKQWDEFKTFNDLKSFDHGDAGSDLLFKENLISLFKVNKEDHEVISKAIIDHNKLNFDKNNYFSRIVRDADKIDILKKYMYFEIGGSDLLDGVNENILQDFKARKPINIKQVKSKLDFVLLRYSFVFDLNFTYSYEIILKEMFNTPHYEELKPFITNDDYNLLIEGYDEVVSYLKEKTNKVRIK